jgi:hypothetical protein
MVLLAVLFLLVGPVLLLLFAFWLWMLIDCATNEPSEGNDKIVWIIVILFAHWIGAAIYFFVRRPKRLELQRAAARKAEATEAGTVAPPTSVAPTP